MKRFKHPQNPIEMFGLGSSIADKHLKVKINSDQALFRAFSKSIIESGKLDNEFISDFTYGYEDYRNLVHNTDLEEISEMTGISTEELIQVGEKNFKFKGYDSLLGYGDHSA